MDFGIWTWLALSAIVVAFGVLGVMPVADAWPGGTSGSGGPRDTGEVLAGTATPSGTGFAVGPPPHAEPAPALPPETSDVPGGGQTVIGTLDGFVTYGKSADALKLTPNETSGRPTLRVEVSGGTRSSLDARIVFPIPVPVKKGDMLLASFLVRCAYSREETAEGTINYFFESVEPPSTDVRNFDNPTRRSVGAFWAAGSATMHRVGQPWTRVHVPFRANDDYGPGEARAGFDMAFGQQTIDFADFTLVNYERSRSMQDLPRSEIAGYEGRELDAPWRIAAAERIDKLRKGDLTIRVVDAAGRPVPDARVRATLAKHEFGFGSAVNAKSLVSQDPRSRRYRQEILKYFNRIVFGNDTKWPQWEMPEWRVNVDPAIAWAHENGLDVRGHVFLWGSFRFMPKDLRDLKDNHDAMRKRILDHVHDAASTLSGRIGDWDVVNEPYTHRDATDVLGDGIIAECFKTARAADPHARLFINDFGILSGGGNDLAHHLHYEKTIQGVIDAGGDLGGIGFQGHFGRQLTSPDRLLQILDRFARFGAALQVTEFDLDVEDEQLQADYTRDLMTVLFSHPAVDAMVMWGFWEGQHWKPRAAMMRRDWSLKPNGHAYADLVLKQWRTEETVQADATGVGRLRGFTGRYEVVADTPDGRTGEAIGTLTRDGGDIVVTLGQTPVTTRRETRLAANRQEVIVQPLEVTAPVDDTPHQGPRARRAEVLLNGEWAEGGEVPVYGGERQFDRKTYRRNVEVPFEWDGRRVRLEFEASNYVTTVFVDDRQVGRHVGAWVPFGFDLTDHVTPGLTFDLRVEVEGMLAPEIMPDGAEGHEAHPLGAQLINRNFGGIVDDVWLRAYGQVHVADAYFRTSVRERTLACEYTLTNATGRASSTRLETIAHAQGGDRTRRFEGPTVELMAGETKVVTVTHDWPDAELWWPDSPNLYHLRTRLLDADGGVLDEETRRIGFREFRVSGTAFELNGVRVNLRGDYCGFGQYWPMEYQTRQNVAKTYRILQNRLNFNALRWHMHPAARYVYDAADETGMLIVCESSIYGRPFKPMPDDVRETYVENANAWLKPWTVAYRHHPSIVLWSPVNEGGPKYGNHQQFTVDEMRSMGATVRELDPTRPIVYHGNPEVLEETVNHHYPFPGGWSLVTTPIYFWRNLLDAERPAGVGEFFQTSHTAQQPMLTREARIMIAEQNKWWLGTWTRGMRYVGIADFRPKIFFWTHQEMESERTRNVAAAFHPVALFDKAYDEKGIRPFIDDELPRLASGTSQTRTLVLYNDDYRDETVNVEVALLDAHGSPVAVGRRAYQIPPGHHVEIGCTFTVPSGETFGLALRTGKANGLRFEEVKRFRTSERDDKTVEASGVLTLGDPVPVRHGGVTN